MIPLALPDETLIIAICIATGQAHQPLLDLTGRRGVSRWVRVNGVDSSSPAQRMMRPIRVRVKQDTSQSNVKRHPSLKGLAMLAKGYPPLRPGQPRHSDATGSPDLHQVLP